MKFSGCSVRTADAGQSKIACKVNTVAEGDVQEDSNAHCRR